MITFIPGDIFASECAILVNPVNCVGVMGKGLALKFKQRYPAMFGQYKRDCADLLYRPGEVRIVWSENSFGIGRRICNFATKDHWREPSKVEWIEIGLKGLKTKLHGSSVALPMIGCGLGGLRWVDVEPLVVEILGDCEEKIEVYV